MFDEETFDALRALHVAFEEGEASLQVVEQQLPLNPPRHLYQRSTHGWRSPSNCLCIYIFD
jgi:hypothetical protein